MIITNTNSTTPHFSTNDNTTLSGFDHTITDLCTPPSSSVDESTRRTAAVASALIEVIHDRLPSSTTNKMEGVTPAAVFASTLNALTATLSIPDDRDDATTSISSSPTMSSPQLPLLEIMRRIVPYVVEANPNLYENQFMLLSRTLRAVVASLPQSSSSAGGTAGAAGGFNALLRQGIRTSTVVLSGVLSVLSNNEGSSNRATVEKETVKCMQGTILDHFDDGRAKVRRLAHASAWELLRFSASKEGDEQQQGGEKKRGIAEEYLLQYCHRILSSSIVPVAPSADGKNRKRKDRDDEDTSSTPPTMTKDRAIRLLHLLTFLESSLSAFDRPGRVLFGEDLVRLVGYAFSFSGQKSGIADGTGMYDVLLANAGFSCLLQILDDPPSALPLAPTPSKKKRKKNKKKKGGEEEEEKKDGEVDKEGAFRMRTWASLLRMNLSLRSFQSSSGDGGSNGGAGGGAVGECRISYARCIVSIASHLPPGGGNKGWEKVASKLLPLSLTSIMNIVGDDDVTSSSTSSVVVVQGLCGEIGRLVRSPTVSHFLTTSTSSDDSTEVVQALVRSIERILHYRYRSAWANGGLSCLASLVVTIVQGILPPPSPSPVEYDEKDIEKAKEMVRPLLDGLFRLHSDLNSSSDKRRNARKDLETMKRALKGTISTIGTGVGIRFLFSVMDITDSSGGIDESKFWIVTALVENSSSSSSGFTENTVVGPYPTNLEFFQKVILGMARRCDVLGETAVAKAVMIKGLG